jgi:hypothetical protein
MRIARSYGQCCLSGLHLRHLDLPARGPFCAWWATVRRTRARPVGVRPPLRLVMDPPRVVRGGRAPTIVRTGPGKRSRL